MGKDVGRREPKHRRSGLRDQNQTTPEWQTSQSPCKRKMGGALSPLAFPAPGKVTDVTSGTRPMSLPHMQLRVVY